MRHDNITLIVIGIIALILGIAIKLFIGRRRFYRRNQSGLETFRNYKGALIISLLEKVITFIGGLLIIIGVLSFGVATFITK